MFPLHLPTTLSLLLAHFLKARESSYPGDTATACQYWNTLKNLFKKIFLRKLIEFLLISSLYKPFTPWKEFPNKPFPCHHLTHSRVFFLSGSSNPHVIFYCSVCIPKNKNWSLALCDKLIMSIHFCSRYARSHRVSQQYNAYSVVFLSLCLIWTPITIIYFFMLYVSFVFKLTFLLCVSLWYSSVFQMCSTPPLLVIVST